MNNDSLIRILLIEDDTDCINLITNFLKDSKDNFQLVTVNTLGDGFSNFSGDEFNIIIFDWEITDNTGIEPFAEIYERYPDIPIITLVKDAENGLLAMEYGAEDYLIKDEFNKEITGTVKKAILRKKADLNSNIFSPVESKYFNVKVLKGYEQGLLEIIEFLPDATFVIDKFGRVVAWNHAIEELTGVDADEMLGKGNHTYALPFYGKRRPILIDMVLDYDKDLEKEYKFIEREDDALIAESNVYLKDKHRIIWTKAVPLYDNQYNVTGAIESVRDITEPKKSEAEIKRALKEKNILLKEIHHRVKNNLQIVSSLLGLQESYVGEDSRAVEVLRESKNRISSMAMVHEMLYQSEDIGSINLHSYIEKLTTNLYYSY